MGLRARTHWSAVRGTQVLPNRRSAVRGARGLHAQIRSREDFELCVRSTTEHRLLIAPPRTPPKNRPLLSEGGCMTLKAAGHVAAPRKRQLLHPIIQLPTPRFRSGGQLNISLTDCLSPDACPSMTAPSRLPNGRPSCPGLRTRLRSGCARALRRLCSGLDRGTGLSCLAPVRRCRELARRVQEFWLN